MADNPNFPQYEGGVTDWSRRLVAELDRFGAQVAQESQQAPFIPGFLSTALPDAAKYASTALRNEHSRTIFVYDTGELLYSDGTAWRTMGTSNYTPDNGCKLLKDSSQSIPSGSSSAVTWDTAVYDPLGMHTPGSSDIIIPAGFSMFRITMQVTWEENSNGVRLCASTQDGGFANGQLLDLVPALSAGVGTINRGCGAWLPCEEGDIISVTAQHTLGTPLNVVTSGIFTNQTWVQLELVK